MLAVVFDMDGVLFDTQKIYVRTWEKVARELDIKDFEKPLKLCIGRNKTDQVEILKTHCGEDFPFEEFYALKEKIFTDFIIKDGVPLMKGTKEILVNLKKLGAKIAIASSSRDDVVRHHLEETGLSEFFDVIIGGNMVKHSKPSPDIYLKACEKLDVEPSMAYAVEDSYNGIDSAVAAGLKTVMIPDTLPPTKEKDAVLFGRFDSLLELSEYFTVKELMNRIWLKYSYASILFENQSGKKYTVSARGTNVMQDGLSSSRGYVIKAYRDGRYAEHSFNKIDFETIDEIIKSVDEAFLVNEELSDRFSYENSEQIEEDSLNIIFSTNIKNHPEELGDDFIVEKLNLIREKSLKVDSRIIDCSVSSTYKKCCKMFISNKKEMKQELFFMTSVISVMAKKDEMIKSYFKSFSDIFGTSPLYELEKESQNVAHCVLELLDAKKIKPGEYDCICTPEVTGMIVHEAFGHGVEMDMFVKDRALAKNYIGEYVASELVTMHDNSKTADEVAAYIFDDEGMTSNDTIIIDKGILKTGISDSLTALRLNKKPTGNGRRQNFERKAYTRMTNTYFEGGNDTVEDMIKSIEYGFMLENATCGMEDPKNWGIQCMVNVAREIKNGEFTGNVFSPVILSGYVPTLLKSISMMSEDVKLLGSGYCGKGYKEWVKVSDGGPYIKAKIELG